MYITHGDLATVIYRDVKKEDVESVVDSMTDPGEEPPEGVYMNNTLILEIRRPNMPKSVNRLNPKLTEFGYCPHSTQRIYFPWHAKKAHKWKNNNDLILMAKMGRFLRKFTERVGGFLTPVSPIKSPRF